MSPLSGWGVFPAGWEARHRPTAEASMTAVCEVLEPNGPEPYSPDPLWEPWAAVAAGVPCRVQQRNSGAGSAGSAVVADQALTVREYLVTLPLGAVPGIRAGEGGHIIRVTGYRPGHGGDPALIGRELRVKQVLLGSLQFERDLVCVENTTQNQGGADG